MPDERIVVTGKLHVVAFDPTGLSIHITDAECNAHLSELRPFLERRVMVVVLAEKPSEGEADHA